MERIRNKSYTSGIHTYSKYSIGTHGYPQVGWTDDHGKRIATTVAKAVWVYHNGWTNGMTIDHIGICKDKLCIKLEHLQLLSNFENARRTRGRDWNEGQCIRGHPNSELIYRSGRLRCQLCIKEDQKKYFNAHKEELMEKQREYRAKRNLLSE